MGKNNRIVNNRKRERYQLLTGTNYSKVGKMFLTLYLIIQIQIRKRGNKGNILEEIFCDRMEFIICAFLKDKYNSTIRIRTAMKGNKH